MDSTILSSTMRSANNRKVQRLDRPAEAAGIAVIWLAPFEFWRLTERAPSPMARSNPPEVTPSDIEYRGQADVQGIGIFDLFCQWVHQPVIRPGIGRFFVLCVCLTARSVATGDVPARSVGPETVFGSWTPPDGRVCHEKH
jgi:hypothetical protein